MGGRRTASVTPFLQANSLVLTIISILIALLVLLAVWEIWICEGAHLGRRFVIWLYDLTARRYDRIKSYDPDWERTFLGEPVAGAISALEDARLLDVGAGTGRLLRALPHFGSSEVRFVCLEPSPGMLKQGRQAVTDPRVQWARGWAAELPLANDAFDLVVCTEVLEFTPNPRATLTELVRVMRPGGWLLVTNRVGWQAPLILGRTFGEQAFVQLLTDCGLDDVRVYPWQMDYDLAWARKTISTQSPSLGVQPTPGESSR